MKKGLSQIVTSILFILIILVAVGILWGVLRNFLLKSTDNQSSVDCLTVDIKSTKCVFTGDSNGYYALVGIKRGADQSNLSDVRLVFDNSSIPQSRTLSWRRSTIGSSLPKSYETAEAGFSVGSFAPFSLTAYPAFSSDNVCSIGSTVVCSRYSYQSGSVCGDFDGSQFIDFTDYDDFVACYEMETKGSTLGDPCSYDYDLVLRKTKVDVTHDGGINGEDYIAYVASYVDGSLIGC